MGFEAPTELPPVAGAGDRAHRRRHVFAGGMDRGGAHDGKLAFLGRPALRHRTPRPGVFAEKRGEGAEGGGHILCGKKHLTDKMLRLGKKSKKVEEKMQKSVDREGLFWYSNRAPVSRVFLRNRSKPCEREVTRFLAKEIEKTS